MFDVAVDVVYVVEEMVEIAEFELEPSELFGKLVLFLSTFNFIKILNIIRVIKKMLLMILLG